MSQINLHVLNRLAFTGTRKLHYTWSASPRSATLPYPTSRELRACRPSGSSLPLVAPVPLQSTSIEFSSRNGARQPQREYRIDGHPSKLPAMASSHTREGTSLIRISKALNGHLDEVSEVSLKCHDSLRKPKEKPVFPVKFPGKDRKKPKRKL